MPCGALRQAVVHAPMVGTDRFRQMSILDDFDRQSFELSSARPDDEYGQRGGK
jgi:hypothetical protein